MRKVLTILVKTFIFLMVISCGALVYTAISRHHDIPTPRIEVQQSIKTPVLPTIAPTAITCIPGIADPIISEVGSVTLPPVVETNTTPKKHHKYESTVVPLK